MLATNESFKGELDIHLELTLAPIIRKLSTHKPKKKKKGNCFVAEKRKLLGNKEKRKLEPEIYHI